MTVDELLGRITAEELAEWSYVLGKEHEISKAVRDGLDPELATRVAFERPDED